MTGISAMTLLPIGPSTDSGSEAMISVDFESFSHKRGTRQKQIAVVLEPFSQAVNLHSNQLVDAVGQTSTSKARSSIQSRQKNGKGIMSRAAASSRASIYSSVCISARHRVTPRLAGSRLLRRGGMHVLQRECCDPMRCRHQPLLSSAPRLQPPIRASGFGRIPRKSPFGGRERGTYATTAACELEKTASDMKKR